MVRIVERRGEVCIIPPIIKPVQTEVDVCTSSATQPPTRSALNGVALSHIDLAVVYRVTASRSIHKEMKKNETALSVPAFFTSTILPRFMAHFFRFFSAISSEHNPTHTQESQESC